MLVAVVIASSREPSNVAFCFIFDTANEQRLPIFSHQSPICLTRHAIFPPSRACEKNALRANLKSCAKTVVD